MSPDLTGLLLCITLTLSGVLFYLSLRREAIREAAHLNKPVENAGVWIFIIYPGGCFLLGPVGILYFAIKVAYP